MPYNTTLCDALSQIIARVSEEDGKTIRAAIEEIAMAAKNPEPAPLGNEPEGCPSASAAAALGTPPRRNPMALPVDMPCIPGYRDEPTH
jgi:hypothetical protein